MNIVIIGAKDRDTSDDIADVSKLLDLLEQKYGEFTVVSMMGHMGIGKIVKTACDRAVGQREHRFPFCEADIRVYAKGLTKDQMAQLYTARNATLFEIGDEFYSFPHPQRRAVIDELIEKRVMPAGRPYQVFHCGDDIQLAPRAPKNQG